MVERARRLVEAMVVEMRQTFREKPPSLEFYAVAARQESVRALLRKCFAQGYAFMAALIRQGVDRGEFRPVDTKAMAVAIGALFEGLALLAAVDAAAVDRDRHAEAALDLLLNGLHIQKGE